MDEEALDLSPPRRVRFGVAALVLALHVLALVALVRAFAPDYAAKAVQAVVSTFTVTITAPPPPPPPAPAPEPAGSAGEAGRKAVPREVRAERPKVALAAPSPAPRASSSGSADSSGARETGSGSGAGGQGSGSGSGTGGSGAGGGGGLAGKPVHVSGRIDNARDFPLPPGGREARIGKAVILALTINPEGRAVACRVYRSSGLPETDAVTCRLAMERLRFRPATNAAGEPVSATFYWQQKFFF